MVKDPWDDKVCIYQGLVAIGQIITRTVNMFDEDQQAVEEQFLLLNYVRKKKKVYKEYATICIGQNFTP